MPSTVPSSFLSNTGNYLRMLPYNPRASQEDEGSVHVRYRPPHPTVLVRNENGPSVTFSSPYLRYLSCLAIHGLKVTDPIFATPWLSDDPARVNLEHLYWCAWVPNFWELLLFKMIVGGAAYCSSSVSRPTNIALMTVACPSHDARAERSQ